MDRDAVLAFILAELATMQADGLIAPEATLDANAVLIGSAGIVGSQNLVNLLLALEHHIDATYGQTFDWSNDGAMRAKRSPFRTPATLAEFALEGVPS